MPSVSRIMAMSLIAICLFVPQVAIARNQYTHANISVDYKDKNIEYVLKDISRQTGIQIIINPRWYNKSLSLTLRDVPLNDGLKTMLKNAGFKNYAIEYNYAEKKVFIYIPIEVQKKIQPYDDADTVISEINTEPEVIIEPLDEDINDFVDDDNVASSEDIEADLGTVNEDEEEIATSDEIEKSVSDSGTDF